MTDIQTKTRKGQGAGVAIFSQVYGVNIILYDFLSHVVIPSP